MAQYALIKDNEIINLYDSIPTSFGNEVSGFNLMTDEQRQEWGFYKVTQPDLSNYNPQLHKIDFDEHVIENGIPHHRIVYSNMYTDDQLLEMNKNSFWQTVREYRNILLSKTDWTMMPDVISSKGEKSEEWLNSWTTYRQALRDTTDNVSLFDDNNGIFTTDIFPLEPNL